MAILKSIYRQISMFARQSQHFFLVDLIQYDRWTFAKIKGCIP